MPILLLTSTTISVLIWLLQRIAFQAARGRGLIAVFLAQLTLSISIVFALIFEFSRAIDAKEIDRPVGFGAAMFILLVSFTLILFVLFNLMTAIFIWWQHHRR